jgi:4-aminobutyrate aminotransferase-like enzyme
VSYEFPTIPHHPVETRFRRIVTELPAPESIPLLQDSMHYEALAMQGQPPIVWDRAEGFSVYDAWGNKWIDLTSGVLVTNAGHSRKQIVDAIVSQTQHGLLHNFGFPNEPRIRLAKKLAELTPDPIDRVFLLTTGSETTECAIKQMRTHGRKIDDSKNVIVSFTNAFHGRTLGAQMIGGIPAGKQWIGHLDPGMVQVPFPDGYHCPHTAFDLFEQCLADAGVRQERVAGVICESYQGGDACFAPSKYMQDLRSWCDRHNALLTFDEVQAGFGRSGKLFSFQHYDVVPDLICMGKGVGGSLPLSALAGRSDIMNQHGPLSMTNTHGGNPVCAAAALANIELLISENLVENAAVVGEAMHKALWKALEPYDDRIGAIQGKGLVAGIHCVNGQQDAPDPLLADKIVMHAVGRGLMLFAPVGVGGASIKICPPLCITEDAVHEAVETLAEAFGDVLG